MNIKRLAAMLISAALFITSAPAAFALDADIIEPWERSAETHRENLGNSIAYLETMDTSDYTADSASKLHAAIETAKAEFANETQNAKYYYQRKVAQPQQATTTSKRLFSRRWCTNCFVRAAYSPHILLYLRYSAVHEIWLSTLP